MRMRQKRRLPAWLEFGLLVVITTGLISVGALLLWASFAAIPAIDGFENRRAAESTKIFDRTDNVVLYDVHGTMRRTRSS